MVLRQAPTLAPVTTERTMLRKCLGHAPGITAKTGHFVAVLHL